MASKLTIEGSADAHDFRYPIYVKEVFISKIKGRNNSNINKLRKKYDIKIECIQEGSSNPHFLLIGKKCNVKKAVVTLKSTFKPYITKRPTRPSKNIEVEGKRNVTVRVPNKKLVMKQYDLRTFKSFFPQTVMTVIGLYYYCKSTGTVKVWNHDNGYGFIKIANNSQDVFVHFKGICEYPKNPIKNRSLRKGERVEFVVVVDHTKNGKTKAIFVTGPNGRRVKGYPYDYDDDGSSLNSFYDDDGNLNPDLSCLTKMGLNCHKHNMQNM